jgi:hypothetical protein
MPRLPRLSRGGYELEASTSFDPLNTAGTFNRGLMTVTED